MRILVVEDEQLLADAIGAGLGRHAMAVDVVYDGVAAEKGATVNGYDVIVLDRDLPRLSGDEVCRRVVEAGAEPRILMLTAATAVPERVAGLHLGADDSLTKPFASPNWSRGCRRWRADGPGRHAGGRASGHPARSAPP